MQTVPVQTQNVKAFYAHLDDTPGALTSVGGTIYFVPEDGAIVEITPAHVNFLVTLGEMTMSDAQRLADLMAGGYAKVACGRAA